MTVTYTKTYSPQTVEDLQQVSESMQSTRLSMELKKAKSLEQLLKEIQLGESTPVIANGRLKRFISVLMVEIVRDDRKVLTETNQTFHATSAREAYSRQRNCLLAEKIMADEDAGVAVRRALKEELNITVDNEVDLVLACNFEERYSESSPGLLTRYRTYKATIEVSDLEREIPDGYQHTEYFDDGTERVTLPGIGNSNSGLSYIKNVFSTKSLERICHFCCDCNY